MNKVADWQCLRVLSLGMLVPNSSCMEGNFLWRVLTLAKWQGKHHWRNKLWRIDDESLIKCILK